MSSEPPPEDEPGTASPEPCMACRGTGQVVSHLGGATTTVTCPWCRGGGVRLSDVDAQERWRDSADGQGSEAAEEPDRPPPAGSPGDSLPGGDAA